VAAGEARANAAEPRGAARLQCMASSSSWHPCLLLQVTALHAEEYSVCRWALLGQ